MVPIPLLLVLTSLTFLLITWTNDILGINNNLFLKRELLHVHYFQVLCEVAWEKGSHMRDTQAKGL